MIQFDAGLVQVIEVIDNLPGVVYYGRDDHPLNVRVAGVEIGDLAAGDLLVGSRFHYLVSITHSDLTVTVSQV
jgi:hypothetical protein